jgi:hypothetical protein
LEEKINKDKKHMSQEKLKNEKEKDKLQKEVRNVTIAAVFVILFVASTISKWF